MKISDSCKLLWHSMQSCYSWILIHVYTVFSHLKSWVLQNTYDLTKVKVTSCMHKAILLTVRKNGFAILYIYNARSYLIWTYKWFRNIIKLCGWLFYCSITDRGVTEVKLPVFIMEMLVPCPLPNNKTKQNATELFIEHRTLDLVTVLLFGSS